MASYRELLADRAQGRLLLGGAPADFADWLDYVAIVAIIVYVWQHGPFELALFAVAMTLPYVTVAPLLAEWIDRTELRRVLVASNVIRAATTLALAIAPNIWILLGLVMLRSLADSAFNPARQAALQAITVAPRLAAANALHAGVGQTAKVVGPAVGGALMLVLPVQGVFVVNGLLSGIAVLGFASVTIPSRLPVLEENPALWSRFGAGFAEFRKTPLMFAVLAFVAAAHFTFFLYDTQIALLAKQLGYSATELGITITASGVGGVLAAAFAGRFERAPPLLLLAIPALISGPVTVGLAIAAIFGLDTPFWVFLVAMAIMGGTTVFMMVHYRAVIQRETPAHRIARVVAAGEAIMILALMTAPFVGSIITGMAGIGAPFFVGGLLLTLIGLAGIFTRL